MACLKHSKILTSSPLVHHFPVRPPVDVEYVGRMRLTEGTYGQSGLPSASASQSFRPLLNENEARSSAG